jgi:hypothetical protein
MYRSLHNLVMPLGLYFMPPYQIVKMSLNGSRKQVANHHKTLINPRMEKTSVAMDSGH